MHQLNTEKIDANAMDIDRESTEVTDSHPVDRNAMEHVDEIAYDPEDPAWIDIDDDQAEQPLFLQQATCTDATGMFWDCR